MPDKEVIKANDILDKFDFFNQRAARELWGDKPEEIKEKDIRNFESDVKFLKDLINCQQEKIEKMSNKNKKDKYLSKSEVQLLIQNYIRSIQMNDCGRILNRSLNCYSYNKHFHYHNFQVLLQHLC